MSSLRGKNVLITGGTTGIGFETARAFLAASANVIVTGANPERVASAERSLGANCAGIVSDNASPAASRELSKACEARFGHLDVLVANAGVCKASNIHDVTEAAFDHEMDINFKGTLFLIQACLPLLRPGSVILMTTSVNDVKGIPGQLVYSATKAAMRSMVRTLAAELAPRKIRVNGVAPGPIDTPIFDKALPIPEEAAAMKALEAKFGVMDRIGKPEEVAAAFVFLAGERAGFITGIDLPVAGGWGDV
jgi:NAD(P)-dependent dehydrogenase (short-subunit alcohol dehydrogenase family)